MSRPSVRRVIVYSCLLLLSLVAVGRAQTVRYIYDELGRLIAVIDQNGDAAVYSYDAVGNLLSITRQTAGTVSILEFTPNGGPIGMSVKLFGTGFSATANQNTVTFHGTTATVLSATTTELVTSVPSGATTGTIAITTPSGSATSSASFVVTADPAPTITSVSPTVGAAGTSVTITGTNYQATPSENRVNFNGNAAEVSASTSTTITTSVSSAASSGHLTVTTPYGTATSTDDFFVPPSSYTASDVTVMDRITTGTPKSVTISTSGKIGLLLFDGTSGQRISLKVSTGVAGNIIIYDPHRSVVASAASSGAAEAFIDTHTLSVAGTYMILVDPTGSNTGSVTLTLYDVPADITGAITAGGSNVTVTTTTPGQNGRLTFSGTSGDRISLKASTGPLGTVTILKPDGTSLASVSISAVFATFIDTQTLPATGTYTVVVDYSTTQTGSATLTLYSVPADASASITAGGSAVTLTMSTPGQNGAATFTGTSGHRMAIWVSGVTATSVNVSLRDPSGTTLTSATIGFLGGFIEPQSLSSSGAHSIVVDPIGTNTGNVVLNLYDVPADASGTLTVNGGGTTVTLSTPGQNGAYTFSGTASQQITVHVTSSSFKTPANVTSTVTVKLVRANGTVLTSTTSSGASFNLSTQTLPATETYTVVIDPTSANSGSLTVSVTNP